jgi:hypothetical protein
MPLVGLPVGVGRYVSHVVNIFELLYSRVEVSYNGVIPGGLRLC